VKRIQYISVLGLLALSAAAFAQERGRKQQGPPPRYNTPALQSPRPAAPPRSDNNANQQPQQQAPQQQQRPLR
jgi:hypothetical protein